ncbi:MAG: DMT family transporter [Bacteroidales bacterium]|nr:DMT family transporter [Bacteroidales bacterium]
MHNNKQSYIYAGLAILFWSTIPTAFKTALAESAVLPILTIASIASAAVLLLILIITGKTSELLRTGRKDLIRSAILGLINPFLYYLILLKAYQLLPGQVAQPLNMIWPIVLVFLSVPLLRQRIPAGSFISLFISFAGVYLISSQGAPFNPGRSDTLGVLLAAGSSLLWALYFILNVRDSRDQAVKLFVNFAFASVYLIAACLITQSSPLQISARGLLASVYTGIFEMGLTFWLWLKAMELASSNDKLGNLVYLAPFFSLIFLHFIVHEPVYYTTIAGLILIIAGIMYQNMRKEKAV